MVDSETYSIIFSDVEGLRQREGGKRKGRTNERDYYAPLYSVRSTGYLTELTVCFRILLYSGVKLSDVSVVRTEVGVLVRTSFPRKTSLRNSLNLTLSEVHLKDPNGIV